MTTNELLADLADRNLGMLKMLLADFSDADMLVRPCPGANHANWQLGHLVASEVGMLSQTKAKMPPLPAGLAEKYDAKNTKIDDPAAFLKKDELMDLLTKARAATVQWIKTLTPAEMDQAIPGRMAEFCPTLGHLAGMVGMHVTMHTGQIQVIRRKLGKPILF